MVSLNRRFDSLYISDFSIQYAYIVSMDVIIWECKYIILWMFISHVKQRSFLRIGSDFSSPFLACDFICHIFWIFSFYLISAHSHHYTKE